MFCIYLQEWRHAHGMRCLGIPNTAHFANVTQIEDALACNCYNLLFIIILGNQGENDVLGTMFFDCSRVCKVDDVFFRYIYGQDCALVQGSGMIIFWSE
jgi:hypothetical protein